MKRSAESLLTRLCVADKSRARRLHHSRTKFPSLTPDQSVCYRSNYGQDLSGKSTRLRQGQRHMSTDKSSVSADEISHFDALAATWWDTNGSSGLLHKMNPARIGFIKSHIEASLFPSEIQDNGPLWLMGKKTLDVGCGGGILSEALCRVGGRVTGVDASPAGIAVAKEHARQMGLGVEYLHTSAEHLALERRETYDVVCAMEILEHVSSPPTFLKSVLALLKPGGTMFISTIEKTWFARLLTCTLAEDVLRLVPKGTHNYEKFIPKDALVRWTRELGAEVVDTRGIIFDPLSGSWRVLGRNQAWGEACNYIMAIKKL